MFKSMKHCNGCSQDLPKNEFSKKNAGFQSHCKSCRKIYLQGHYKKNKASYVNRKKLRKFLFLEEMTDLIIKRKSVACKDCRRKFHHCAMTFDHLHDKVSNISDFSQLSPSQKTKDLLEEEFRKCDVVCANCHQIREWNRHGHSFRPERRKRIEALRKRLETAHVVQHIDALVSTSF